MRNLRGADVRQICLVTVWQVGGVRKNSHWDIFNTNGKNGQLAQMTGLFLSDSARISEEWLLGSCLHFIVVVNMGAWLLGAVSEYCDGMNGCELTKFIHRLIASRRGIGLGVNTQVVCQHVIHQKCVCKSLGYRHPRSCATAVLAELTWETWAGQGPLDDVSATTTRQNCLETRVEYVHKEVDMIVNLRWSQDDCSSKEVPQESCDCSLTLISFCPTFCLLAWFAGAAHHLTLWVFVCP